jgi:hypothetical protein
VIHTDILGLGAFQVAISKDQTIIASSTEVLTQLVNGVKGDVLDTALIVLRHIHEVNLSTN